MKLRIFPSAHARAWALLVALAAVGCTDEEPGSSSANGSGATCPPTSTLDYESFGRPFMQTYCVRCHASTLSDSDREGAPSDHNFDTLENIHSTPAEHIDEQAAAGPNRVNTAMPPGEPRPTEDERRDLGEWLACDAR